MGKYIHKNAVEYAKKWAYSRNPKYYAFDKIGGDCTNFISQCLYAGCKIMNFAPTFGWYYIDSTNRSPSWTGVEFLYKFLINNKGPGPYAIETSQNQIKTGDIIQLGNSEKFYHSLIVVSTENNNIFVAAHDFNTYMKNLNTYHYEKARFLHIAGVN